MYAGLDIGGKRTAICVIDESGKLVWRRTVDTHPEMIEAAFSGSRDRWIRSGSRRFAGGSGGPQAR
jgi:predicted NBD/HSP70 family sugar kinase